MSHRFTQFKLFVHKEFLELRSQKSRKSSTLQLILQSAINILLSASPFVINHSDYIFQAISQSAFHSSSR